MKQRGPYWLGAALLLASATWAQLDLGAMYTQTVKANQPWAAIDTKVNSLSLNVQINRGVVTTVATVEYTPSNGFVNEYVCVPVVCDPKLTVGCDPRQCEYRNHRELPLDSLETTANFIQADNTVITDMYLWVGDAKVKAALQDRALASAQYEDIVKRRKDPALIETWGNGHYNLRIFPNESMKSRKIEIEFVQGLETDGDAFRTVLPIVHRLAKVASAGTLDYSALPNRTIGSVSLTAVALDGKTYSLKWEGLGSGEVSSNPLRLSASQVSDLKEGVLSVASAACAGCATPWIAEKAGASYFGVKTLLEAKKIKFEAQPAERHFLLDVKGKDTLMAARARKVALLSLKAYAAAPYVGNLGLADGKGNIAYVFPKPVSMDDGNLRKAYEALKAWQPNTESNAHATLRAYARARTAASGGAAGGGGASVAYLVNNDTTPYFNWGYLPNTGRMTRTQTEYEAWEKTRAALEDETLAALQGANAMLFGFWNDYRLNRLATATGGFQVGAMHGYIYYPMRGGVAVDMAIPEKPSPISGIHLPPLFGPGRPDAYSIVDLEIAASGHPVSNLVALQAQTYFRYYGRGILVEAMPMAKRSDLVAPWGHRSVDSVTLRISGQYQGSGQVSLKVTGLWGGLRFAQEIQADLPSAQGASMAGAGIWAYQQGEAWGRESFKYDLAAVQKLGRDYHIVNRQMSLLALEPGMDLWTQMPSPNGGTVATAEGAREVKVGAPTASDMIAGGSQTTAANLDLASLEDILNSAVPVLEPAAFQAGARGAGEISLRRSGSSLELAWSLPGAPAEAATLRILDLSGKAVAELRAVRTAAGYAAEWRNPGLSGAYFVVAQAGGRTLVKKILVRP